MLRAYKSYIVSKEQHVIPLCVGGGGLPLTNNNPYQQQNQTTPYVIVFHNNSTLPKYCNSALYSENKRYVLLKKIFLQYDIMSLRTGGGVEMV